MHQNVKPHLAAKADLVCMDLKQRKSLQDEVLWNSFLWEPASGACQHFGQTQTMSA